MAKRLFPNAPQAPGGPRESYLNGRPSNWFKLSCKEKVAKIDLPEFWANIAVDLKERTADRMEAALRLVEYSEGKAQQSLDITQHDDSSRPTTEALIETIRTLREQLGAIGKGTQLETGK